MKSFDKVVAPLLVSGMPFPGDKDKVKRNSKARITKETKLKTAKLSDNVNGYDFSDLFYCDKDKYKIIEKVLHDLRKDIKKEYSEGKTEFFQTIISTIKNNPSLIFESTILDSVIREKGGSRYLSGVIKELSEKEYDNDFYDVINKYFFYILLEEIIKEKGKLSEIFPLNNENIDFLKQMGFLFEIKVGKQKECIFIKNKTGIGVYSYVESSKLTRIGYLYEEQINYIEKEILKILFNLQDKVYKSYKV